MADRFLIPPGFGEHEVDDEQIDVANYVFPGPIAEKFAHSSGYVDFIQGPYGSGKTTAVFFRCLQRASRMPICRDGWRRYRVVVLRDTYRRMKETAIKSWHKWFPPSAGQWTGGQDRPSEHVLEFEDLDGVPTRFEIKFAAVGDLDIEDFMGGLETTDLVLNEANLLNQDVLTYGIGRTGRYPSIKDLPDDLPIRGFPGYTLGNLPPGMKLAQLPPQALFDHGAYGDCNAPEFDSYLLQMQFGDIIDTSGRVLGRTNFFVQPGGRSVGAENLDYLPPGYYDMLAAANAHQSWWVSRMIDNKPGYSRHGKPVYEEYNDEVHGSKEALRIIPSLPLLWGFDAGLHPAALCGHWLPDGQFRILQEFYYGHCGPTRFGEQVRNWIDQHAREIASHRGWSDPTAFDGVDKLSGEQSWVQIVQAITGINIEPAPSNEPALRQDAVRQALTYMIDGTKPGLLVDPSCKMFRKGAASNYRYIKIRSDIGDTFTEKPHKDEWSNLQDCGQYLMLGARGKAGVISRRTGQRPNAARRGAVVQVKTDFNVFG